MDRELLIRLGESMFGRNWKMPLARALHYDERTIRRWAKGTWTIPAGVAAHLKLVAADRLATIEQTIVEAQIEFRELESVAGVESTTTKGG